MFIADKIPKKSKEAQRLTRIANRASKRTTAYHRNGPVSVFGAQSEVAKAIAALSVKANDATAS